MEVDDTVKSAPQKAVHRFVDGKGDEIIFNPSPVPVNVMSTEVVRDQDECIKGTWTEVYVFTHYVR